MSAAFARLDDAERRLAAATLIAEVQPGLHAAEELEGAMREYRTVTGLDGAWDTVLVRARRVHERLVA